jgi:tetratricopeptide (TPR) repeat protein
MKDVALGVVVALLLLPGCGKKAPQQVNPPKGGPPPDTAGPFYASISGVAAKVDSAYTEFVKHLGRIATAQPDLAAMKKAQEQYARALAEAKTSLQTIQVPADKKGAQQLHDALERYIKAEEVTMKAANQIAQAIEGALKGQGNFNAVGLGTQLNAMEQERQKARIEFQQALETFAKNHKIPGAGGP